MSLETSGESKPLEQITEKVVRKADGSGAALQSVQYSSTSTMNRERIGTDLYRNKSFLEETQRMIRKK